MVGAGSEASELGRALDVAALAAVEETSTAADLIRWGAERFGEHGLWFGHGTDNPVDEAAALALHVLGLDPHDCSRTLLEKPLDRSVRIEIVALLVQRIRERKPTSYLTRRAWFAGLEFYVDERVLVPRSPIAEWIERRFSPWVEGDRVRRVLDLGTGSGCIAIACAKAFPNALVDALDISADALDVARINVRRHRTGTRVRLLESDLFERASGPYDLIVSNPPYVDEHELFAAPPEYRHEPPIGLRAGKDGLQVVRTILGEARRHLCTEGVLVVEVGTSRDALVEAFPCLPFVWLDLARGGENVFLLDARDLPAPRPGTA